MDAATAAVMTATSSRSSVTASSTGAAGAGTEAGAAAGVGAFFSTAFFLLNFFSIAGIKLKQEMIRLIRIRTVNTTPMPRSVFMPAFCRISPVL